jgi:hypothetical protein
MAHYQDDYRSHGDSNDRGYSSHDRGNDRYGNPFGQERSNGYRDSGRYGGGGDVGGRGSGSGWGRNDRGGHGQNAGGGSYGRHGGIGEDVYGGGEADYGGGYGEPGSGSRSGTRGGYGSGGSYGAGGGGYGAGSRGFSESIGGYGQGTGSYGQESRGGEGGTFGRYQQQGEHRGKGPKGYTRSDDRIKEQVCECLADDHMLDASDIDVHVKGGEVTLGGTVSDRQAKRRAEDLLEHLGGVNHVQNNLRVKDQNSETGKASGSTTSSTSRT